MKLCSKPGHETPTSTNASVHTVTRHAPLPLYLHLCASLALFLSICPSASTYPEEQHARTCVKERCANKPTLITELSVDSQGKFAGYRCSSSEEISSKNQLFEARAHMIREMCFARIGARTLEWISWGYRCRREKAPGMDSKV